MRSIPYGRQTITEEDIEAVSSVLRSDRLTQGPLVEALERALCDLCGTKHCVMVSNGSIALQLACLALGVGAGDVGLTSPISFLASANCIASCGGRPDFVDIESDSLCLSPASLEAYCETRPIPKVVIPVDFAGVPADLPRLRKLSETYGFTLIEDAAHAVGSTYRIQGYEYACGSCSHTDMAILSFHPVKSMTTGEGGAVLTNDEELAFRVRLLANHGVVRDPTRYKNRPFAGNRQEGAPSWYYEMQALGFNGRITDIQCALGLSQMKRLAEFKARRQDVAREYNRSLKGLADNEIVMLPPWPEHTDPCFHLYPLRLGARCKITRDQLFEDLQAKGIRCQVHYIPIYQQPFYQERYHYEKDRFPAAEAYYASCISLPLFPAMDEETLQYVVEILLKLLDGAQ